MANGDFLREWGDQAFLPPLSRVGSSGISSTAIFCPYRQSVFSVPGLTELTSRNSTSLWEASYPRLPWSVSPSHWQTYGKLATLACHGLCPLPIGKLMGSWLPSPAMVCVPFPLANLWEAGYPRLPWSVSPSHWQTYGKLATLACHGLCPLPIGKLMGSWLPSPAMVCVPFPLANLWEAGYPRLPWSVSPSHWQTYGKLATLACHGLCPLPIGKLMGSWLPSPAMVCVPFPLANLWEAGYPRLPWSVSPSHWQTYGKLATLACHGLCPLPIGKLMGS